MGEETKPEEKPQPMGFQVTEEELDRALEKVWLEWMGHETH